MKYYLAIKRSQIKTGEILGTSLVVQWLRLCTSIAGGTSLILGWGTKILHAMQCGQKKKKNRGNSNKIGGLYQFQYPGCHILKF